MTIAYGSILWPGQWVPTHYVVPPSPPQGQLLLAPASINVKLPNRPDPYKYSPGPDPI